MKIQRVDPADLDLATAAELAAVNAAAIAVSAPQQIPMTAEGLQLQAQYGHDGSPEEGLWLVRGDGGDLLGHGSLQVSRWDNPQLALVFSNALPGPNASDVRALVLDAQIEVARELDRSLLLTFAPLDGDTARFLAANGFTVGQRQAQRRLKPQDLDYARIAELNARAADAAADYELIRLDGPAPEELLPELTQLFEAINDAPTDDIDLGLEEFPVERVRRYDAAMLARRQHVCRILARERRTGDWAGHTILCVDGTRPGYAVQEDTSVRRSHRGHQLGMLLKSTMLLWMRELHPELTAIDTWNATSNAHMIAVNDELGCEVSLLGVAMQRTL